MFSYRSEIRRYIDSHKSEIVELLKELVRIPSVRGEAMPDAPFGKECSDVLLCTEAMYKKYGFECELDGEGGYLLSYFGKAEKSLGIFAHADVVPAGEGWTLTSPFEPKEVDGFLVGRGVMDDKAAIVASLFVARIINELSIPFNSRLLLFTGSSEESGMGDIKNYLKSHTPPDFALVPDSCFPLYRGNKGRILMKAVRNSALGEIKSLVGGGGGTNVGEAEARLEFCDKLFVILKSKDSEGLSVTRENDEIVISAKGIAKHTALPEGSVNAVALIADALRDCKLLSEKTREICAFLYGACTDHYGGYLGISCEDSDFGKSTFVNYGINADEACAELNFNIRFGASADIEKMKAVLAEKFSEHDFDIEILDESIAHIVPADHSMLRSLMNTFGKFTGKTNGKMYVNAGGTYAQLLPCAAEIGVTTKGGKPDGLPTGHGAVHQPDECISIDGLLEAIELTTLMILECDKALNK